MRRLALLVLLAATAAFARPTVAAESFDNCAGYIDSVPATIATQGVWCLRGDLSTAIAAGAAISVSTNNVTIDCNHFKLGGLAAGAATQALGILAIERQNIAVRNCSIRGFLLGLGLLGSVGGGHIVENNRFDNNTHIAVSLSGVGSIARNNLIRDTGGSTVSPEAFGLFIGEGASAIDNIVSGVVATAGSNGEARGIHCNSSDGPGYASSIVGNQIQGVAGDGAGLTAGIYIGGFGGQIVTGNRLSGIGQGIGVVCSYSVVDSIAGNIIHGYATAVYALCADEGNIVR